MLKRKCTCYIFLLLLGVIIFSGSFITKHKGNVYASGEAGQLEQAQESQNDDSDLYNSQGFYIKSYNVIMNVKANNVIEIYEEINCYFHQKKHGIYRDISQINKVERLDGSKITTYAQITDIFVNSKYKKNSTENGEIRLVIGDENKFVSGDQTYIISYNYNLGKDRTTNYDELYFNIIGTGWQVPIKEVTFSISMPKEFDASLLGFSSGYLGSDTNNVRFEIKEKVITGETTEILEAYEALTVRLQLPEGYFVGAGNISDFYLILSYIAPAIIFVLVLFVFVIAKNKNKRIKTVEFYPPEGVNSTDVALVYKGKINNKDAVSLLVLLADKGYLKIEKYFNKKDDYKLVKVKEYDGNNKQEKDFFNALFNGRATKTVKLETLKKEICFAVSISSIVKDVNSKMHKCEYFDTKREWIGPACAVLGVISILFSTSIVLFTMPVWMIIYVFPITAVFMSRFLPRDFFAGLFMLLFGGVPLVFAFNFSAQFGLIFFIAQILGVLEGIFMISVSNRLHFRTVKGAELNAKILGFRHFIKIAEKSKLEALCNEDPTYFYNILPYAYVLGVSNVWIKKFEGIAMAQPKWYNAPAGHVFSISTCSHIMSSASRVSRISSSRVSGGRGGSSGGGFSGGGSGGGGGGSW